MRFFGRLNAQEQRELQGRMEKKQMKEFMTVGFSLQKDAHIFREKSEKKIYADALDAHFLLTAMALDRCTLGWSKDALTTALMISQRSLYIQERTGV